MNGWTIHPDGGFDLDLGGVGFRGAYPALDDAPLRPVGVEVGGDAARYDLGGGRAVELRFGDGSLAASLIGFGDAPRTVHPIHGATPAGVDRAFRQGLGFGGPGGFVRLADVGDGGVESCAVLGLTAAGGRTAAVGPADHRRFACRFGLRRQRHSGGLVGREVHREGVTLEAAYSTERVPTGGRLDLPPIRLVSAAGPWAAMREWGGIVASAMDARRAMPPAWHWCSWYRHGANFTLDLLRQVLDEFAAIDPPLGLRAVQIDDGICDSPGDWPIPSARWPGGAEAAFGLIADRGYRPGIWVAPFMVGSRSRLAAEHPDWLLLRDDGTRVVHWKNYDAHGIPSHVDEETYVLDTTHPDALDYILGVFRQFRAWGCRFFKTDFMDWGLRDATMVRRHQTGETGQAHFRRVCVGIREAIGDDGYWLGCIAPFSPLIGLCDGMRVANDVGPAWGRGGAGNMLAESFASLWMNGLWWQNDPDVFYLRDRYLDYDGAELRTLALWDGITGGAVVTSDFPSEIPAERLALWRFLRPGEGATTFPLDWGRAGDPSRHLTHGGTAALPRGIVIAVRDYGGGRRGVLAANPEDGASVRVVDAADLGGGRWFDWSERGATPAEVAGGKLIFELPRHGCRLLYASDDAPPPAGLTVGGYAPTDA